MRRFAAGDGEEEFRPLDGLTPWDRRDLLALMNEVAQQFPPASDQDAMMWGWVTTVVDRWIERNKPVPAKLMLAYNELQEEHRRCLEVAECVAEQIRTLPKEHRKGIAAEVLELIAQRHRDTGETVPMWLPIAFELFGPDSDEERD